MWGIMGYLLMLSRTSSNVCVALFSCHKENNRGVSVRGRVGKHLPSTGYPSRSGADGAFAPS